MPVYNGGAAREPWLRMAIQSILDQTMPNFEFVIVDDGSTDNTAQIVHEYMESDPRIRLLKLAQNSGIVAALNHGLSNCIAPYVARQDSDDISTVTRLEIEKSFLDARPETAMCGTWMYVIDGEGKLKMHCEDRPCNYVAVKDFLRTGCPFVHGSVMFRRQIVVGLGGYSSDPQFQHAEDYELWVRLASRHVVENIPNKTLYFHRDHNTKIGQVHSVQQQRASVLIAEIAKRTLS